MAGPGARLLGAAGGVGFFVLFAGPELFGQTGISFDNTPERFFRFWSENTEFLRVTHFTYALAGIGLLLFRIGLREVLRELEGGSHPLTTLVLLASLYVITLAVASYGIAQGSAITVTDLKDPAMVKLAAVTASVFRHFIYFGITVVVLASAALFLRSRGGLRWLAWLACPSRSSRSWRRSASRCLWERWGVPSTWPPGSSSRSGCCSCRSGWRGRPRPRPRIHRSLIARQEPAPEVPPMWLGRPRP